MVDSTERFSKRADSYVKYRPHYPLEVLKILEYQYQFAPYYIIADVGSGTGISSELFLRANYKVIGIEPNKAMREKSIHLLQSYEKFSAINSTAENTTLPYSSIHAIIAGQSFHWFNSKECKKEFKRILNHNGWVILIWNERLTTTDFESEYEKFITNYGDQYSKIDHRNMTDKHIEDFFFPQPVQRHDFENLQLLNFEGLKGRLLSSSYMPTPTDDNYNKMIIDLQKIFAQYQFQNQVQINYTTKVYVGQL